MCTVGKEDGGTAVGRGVNRGHNFCRLRSRSTAFPPPDCVCLLPHTHTRTHVRLPPPTNLQRDPQHIYNAHLIFVYKTYRKLPSATRSSIRIERRKIETPEFSIHSLSNCALSPLNLTLCMPYKPKISLIIMNINI